MRIVYTIFTEVIFYKGNHMFKTISCESSREEIFTLNQINKFLVKKFPKEQDGRILVDCWKACFIAQYLLDDSIDLNRIKIAITPEELYFKPNPRISSCFDKWLEMFKKDNVSQSKCIILDSIPGNSEPLSMEVKGIPEESVSAFVEVLDKINTGAMISRNEIEEAIDGHHE